MSVFVKLKPYADEPLAAFVARVAHANRYLHAHDILVQADLQGGAQSVAARAHKQAKKLAETLGIALSDIEHTFAGAMTGNSVSYFGVRVRRTHIEGKTRRVSPRSLTKSPYVKAVWSVRQFSFDPLTRERLLLACPVCSRRLGYSRTQGVTFCDNCVDIDDRGFPRGAVDLRDFPQPIVEVADYEALDFITWLIDPDPARAAEKYDLHDSLRDVSRIDLFEMALAIISALIRNVVVGGAAASAHNRMSGMQLQPHDLSRVGRIILDWPGSLLEECEQAAANSKIRTGHYGLYKDIGAIAGLPLDLNLTAPVKLLLRTVLLGYGGAVSSSGKAILNGSFRDKESLVALRDCSDDGRISQKNIKRLVQTAGLSTFSSSNAKRSPFYLVAKDIDPLIQAYKNLMGEVTVAQKLGLPEYAVQDLAHMGILHFAEGPECEISRSDRNYRANDLWLLEGNIRLRLRGKKPKPGFSTLQYALSEFPACRFPWGPVISLIVSGDIEAAFHKDKGRGLFGTIKIADIAPHRQKIEKLMEELPTPSDYSVGTADIFYMLGLAKYKWIADLFNAEYLPRNQRGRANFSDVARFASEFIFPSEIARTFSIRSHDVRQTMSSAALVPAFDVGNGGIFFYRRDAVDAIARGRSHNFSEPLRPKGHGGVKLQA